MLMKRSFFRLLALTGGETEVKGKTPNYQAPLSAHFQVGCDCTLCGVMIMTAGKYLYAKASARLALSLYHQLRDFDVASSWWRW